MKNLTQINRFRFYMASTHAHSDQVVQAAASYATNLLRQESINRRPFHNIHHTERVVQKCQELMSHYDLSAEEHDAVLIAAWFHDTGYSLGNRNHEAASVKIVRVFLDPYGFPPSYVKMIEELILSTQLINKPKTIHQQILRDSDLHHLASAEYETWSKLLQQELREFFGINFSDEDWNRENIAFFKAQHYMTDYAKAHWETLKKQNLEQLARKCF